MSNDGDLDFRKELEYDYKKYLDFGINIHRRLTFKNSEEYFYVTTDSIKREDYSFGNDYLLSYWDTDAKRVEALLKFEIGDESPANGKLICYGDFEPSGRDLKNIRYKCIYGRYEFKSAKDTLDNHEEDIEELIDIDKFFRLKFELADIGEQSKALYDENNAIIDGSAGTGKSTIALQKLKYLESNKKIPQERMLIIVKNNHLKIDFKSLLEDENLKLNDIEIKTVDELNSSIKNYNIDSLKQSKQESFDIKKIFNNFILARNAICIIEHYKSLLIFFHNKGLLNKEEKYSLENIKEWQYEYTNSVYKNYFLALEYLHRYKNYHNEIHRTQDRKITITKRIEKIEQKLNNENLTDKEYETYEKLEIELGKLEKKEIEKYSLSREQNLILKDILKKLYFNKVYIDNYLSAIPNYKKDLVVKYLNLGEYAYNTILIDEAQDYSLVELEVIRLYAERVILTGDILQNLDNGEISDWSDILNVNEIYNITDKNGEDKLNIFTLKHNFRQTYQLANASYNFRQLLLDKKLEDIESEYYLSEKEFKSKPYQLPTILLNHNIEQYLSEKIEHIKNTFTSQVPIVLVYKTNKEKENYQQKLVNFKLSYDTEKIENIDVILIDILEAKGKQFPVVVSSLDGLSDREIYLIMTRGQFEVEFLSSKKEVDNKYLKILKEKSWIETKDIKFISIKAPKESANSKKDKELKITNSSQNRKPNNAKVSEDEEKIKPKIKEQTPKDKEKPKSTDDNASSSESIKNDLLDAKRKHEGEIEEIVVELNPTVIQDIDKYIEKAQKEYEKNLKNAPIKTTTHIVTRNVKVGTKETKWFLEKQYQGLCQICGFTFSKRNGKGQYFNLFNWFSEKISKQKVNLVQAGSSLSLCSRCHSGVKYGSFKTDLTDILKDIDISKLNFDDFVSKISISVNKKEIPECYDFIEMDMYKVDINLFGREQFIFYTEEHFLHLYTMLSLRK